MLCTIEVELTVSRAVPWTSGVRTPFELRDGRFTMAFRRQVAGSSSCASHHASISASVSPLPRKQLTESAILSSRTP
jgi:hypothetical protein